MSITETILQQSDDIQAKKNRRDRKEKGVFYTPPEVVERMTEKVLSEVDLKLNPYIRVLDPACGTGLFLAKAYEVLKRKFEEGYSEILDRNKELEGSLSKDDIGRFVVENNLWGADIDREALDTAHEILVKLAGKACRTNLLLCDSLLDEIKGQFEYILGNPPYIGHKQVSGTYKKALQKVYTGIYRDKSDISYCFLKRGIDLLKEGGSLSFITSRYFIEGPSAEGLRAFIKGNSTIIEIIDFYGRSIFSEAGVAACIITLRKDNREEEISVLKQKQGINAPHTGLFNPSNFVAFKVKAPELSEKGWVLLSPERLEIFSKLDGKEGLLLSDLADSFQGIITGCDRAFIVDRETILEKGIEASLIRPWIKNSSILKYGIKASELFLIYSDFIKDEADYPNAIKHIAGYRDRLQERRECKRGVREWYQLQWGRTNAIFETPKIVYPYKSKTSRFVVDEAGNYCSADIYSLKLKKDFQHSMTLDYIAAVLNSKLFEFYFKCYGKKISEDLYDYYPNTVLKMKIPMPDCSSKLKELTAKLRECGDEASKKYAAGEIDRAIYMLYGLNNEQVKIVEEAL